MPFIKAAVISDVPAGSMKKVTVNDIDILVANVDGNFYALNNKCPHKGGPLCEGKLENNVIHCPWHKAMFEVNTGKNISPAKIGPLSFKVKDVQSYKVKVEGNEIMVEVS